ncbi:MAG: hypothetical protein QM804_05430 [Propionicimonas sp.]
MTRSWSALAGIVFVAGLVHTAYAYSRMEASAAMNSAPSEVALITLVPYALLSVLLLIPVLVARYRRLNSRRPSVR